MTIEGSESSTIGNGVQYHEDRKIQVPRKFKFYETNIQVLLLETKNVAGTCHCSIAVWRCSACMQPGTRTRTLQL